MTYATDLNQSLALSAGDFLVFVRSIQNVLTPFDPLSTL